ncbi:MAG: hypothetical protein AVDCRST_MAG75-2172 [uncultured Propionibacteriaceae bacterium]|uniref:Secreted protein n=1 Tax=uncultured Propionibacteriaceae bacterium TaxID=257457 RepID=A0A6J4P5A9_9ACTN|nr:MAG: hypothetical protein AVDCRST_MAG75-2172 [uncultured Propionibacteriaceae bacterium]
MSRQLRRRTGHRRRSAAGLLAVLAALVALLLVAGGGTAITATRATFIPDRIPVVGRTGTICTVGAKQGDSSTSLSAVVMRQAPGRDGTLTGTPSAAAAPSFTLTEQGKGQVLPGFSRTVLLEGKGVMATASTASVVTVATTGAEEGLMAAPCQPPRSGSWLVGVGAGRSYRSELVLTNPDDAQAEVNLRYYGRNGLVVVPGSPGVVVAARSSTVVALEPLVAVEGPLTVAVRAEHGRVVAVARSLATSGQRPTGADWHLPSSAPSLRTVIPGIPEGDGTRELFVVNPGTTRAQVGVEVLGEQGSFAPAGAETIEVPPESTAAVQLADGLAGAAGAVRLTSDVPVTGSMVSRSTRPTATPDLAVQSAAPAMLRTGLVAVATTDAADSELVMSNDTDTEVSVSMEVLSYAGVTLRRDDILLAPNSTATRGLNSPAPSYLVVRAPGNIGVYGGVVLSQPEGASAGLTTMVVSSPDVASRAPRVRHDPTVGR